MSDQRRRFADQRYVFFVMFKRAEDWRWSSARWYTWQQSVGVPIFWIDCRVRVGGGV